MARRGMGLDSVVRAKILTSGISLSFVLWWWSKQPSPAQKVGGKWVVKCALVKKINFEKREGLRTYRDTTKYY